MGDYFKPWRRKIGVMTLVLACVAMAELIRCYSKHDSFILTYGNDSSIQLLSACRCLIFVKTHSNGSKQATHFTWETFRWADNHFLTMSSQTQRAVDCKRFCLASFDSHFNNHDAFATCFAIPYWSIVIPLTLLSAYLLLARPRVAKPTSAPADVPIGLIGQDTV